MSKRYVCRICTQHKEPCYLDEPIGMHPHICPYIDRRKPEWRYVPEHIPQPEPELMTGYEAIAKAAREGGEVWHAPSNEFRVSFDSEGKIIKVVAEINISSTTRIYTVRPLPPDLMPCPFCGGKPKEHPDGTGVYVRCEVCGAATPYDEKQKAIAAWNRRSSQIILVN